MRIFISHSGALSREVATVLREWIPSVLQAVTTWVSSEDIPKGSRWSQEVGSQLNETCAGIIVVVPGNATEPWINFEAGALSKSISSALVSPFLFGVTAEELPATLSQFQATTYDREDVSRLMQSLNKALADAAVPPERLKRTFELCWPGLEEALAPSVETLRELKNTSATKNLQKEALPSEARVSLSGEAAKMLSVTALSKSGLVIKSETLGGVGISTNDGDAFLEHGASRREAARWEGALEELESYGLVEDKSGDGNVFFLTRDGYDVADQLAG